MLPPTGSSSTRSPLDAASVGTCLPEHHKANDVRNGQTQPELEAVLHSRAVEGCRRSGEDRGGDVCVSAFVISNKTSLVPLLISVLEDKALGRAAKEATVHLMSVIQAASELYTRKRTLACLI